MSHHPQGLLVPRQPWPLQQPNRAKYPILYLLSTPLPTLQRVLLVTIAAAVVGKRPYCASQERLGRILGRSRETVNRAIHALAVQRLIVVKRRGRRLTNVYRLAHRIWQAITGHNPPCWKERQLHLRYEAARQAGLKDWQAPMVALGWR